MQSGCIASDDRTHSAKECPDVKATPSPRSQPAGSGKAWHEFVAELNTLSLLGDRQRKVTASDRIQRLLQQAISAAKADPKWSGSGMPESLQRALDYCDSSIAKARTAALQLLDFVHIVRNASSSNLKAAGGAYNAVPGPVSHTTFLAQLSPSKAAPEQPVITSGAQPDSGALPPLTAAAIRAAWGQAGRRLSMTQSGQPTIVVRSSSPQATQKGATTIVVTPPSPSHRPATSQQAPLTPLNSARLRARFATQRPASPTAPPAPSAATSATGRAKAAVGRVPAASVVSAPNAIMADPNSSTATGTAATDDGDRAWALQTELSDDVEPTPGHTFPTPAAAPPEPSPFASAMPATSDGDIARSEGTAAEADNPPSASEGPLATLSPNGGAKRGNGHGRVSDLQERPSKLLRMSRALSINTVLQCVDGQDTKESLGAAVGGAATTVQDVARDVVAARASQQRASSARHSAAQDAPAPTRQVPSAAPGSMPDPASPVTATAAVPAGPPGRGPSQTEQSAAVQTERAALATDRPVAQQAQQLPSGSAAAPLQPSSIASCQQPPWVAQPQPLTDSAAVASRQPALAASTPLASIEAPAAAVAAAEDASPDEAAAADALAAFKSLEPSMHSRDGPAGAAGRAGARRQRASPEPEGGNDGGVNGNGRGRAGGRAGGRAKAAKVKFEEPGSAPASAGREKARGRGRNGSKDEASAAVEVEAEPGAGKSAAKQAGAVLTARMMRASSDGLPGAAAPGGVSRLTRSSSDLAALDQQPDARLPTSRSAATTQLPPPLPASLPLAAAALQLSRAASAHVLPLHASLVSSQPLISSQLPSLAPLRVETPTPTSAGQGLHTGGAPPVAESGSPPKTALWSGKVKHKLGESTVELFYMTALVPEKFLEQLPPTLFVSELANRNNVKLGKHYVMRCNLGFMTDKQLHKLTMLANVKLVAVCHLQHCTLTLVPDIHPKNGLRVVGFLLADD